MNHFAEYLIKSALALTVLYLFYWVLLRKDTHFRLNRLVLVFSLVGSLIAPLINIYLLANQEIQSKIPVFYASLGEVVVGVTSTEPVKATHSIDWWKVLLIIYLAGVFVVTARLVYQAIYLHVISRMSETRRKGNFTLVLMSKDITPFTYFNKIYIPASKADDFSVETILAHERSHLRQYHFIDLFVMEVVTILQWFNPVVWLYERALKEVHEYLADESVLNQGQHKGTYQALLVNQAIGGPVFSLTNNFNQSLIKKRILMMTKMKTPRLAQLKVLIILPLLLLILVAFADPKAVVKPIVQKGNELILSVYQPVKERRDTINKSNSDTIKQTAFHFQTGQLVSGEGATPQIADKLPEFPGGSEALFKFQLENIKYPAEAQMNKVDGTVLVKFTVDYQGKVTDPQILQGIGSGCDQEVLRWVRSLPYWTPAQKDGKNVSVYYLMTIGFFDKNGKSKLHTDGGDTIYTFVEKQPEFPGGIDSLMSFLAHHIKYPKEALDKNIEGKVLVQFVVDNDGKTRNAKVLKGIGGGCDEEAIRVVNAMPLWKPGMHGGKNVSVFFTLPIQFQFEKKLRLYTECAKIFADKAAVPEIKCYSSDDWSNYVKSNIKRPQLGKEKDKHGNVWIYFKLLRSGEIKDLKIYRSLGIGYDEEALRLVKLYKNWKIDNDCPLWEITAIVSF